MKKGLILFLILVGIFFLQADVRLNPDEPVKGEWNFKPEMVWHQMNAGEDLILRVAGLDVDEQGNVYILERKHNKVMIFDTKGNFIRSFGRSGEGPGEFKFVLSINFIENNIIITDIGRLHYFSKEGTLIKTVKVPEDYTPEAFIDQDRFFYVFKKYEKEGKGKADIIKIYNIKTKEDKPLLELKAAKEVNMSAGNMRITLMIQDISIGYFNNLAYMAKGDNYLIKKYNLENEETDSFGLNSRKRKKITMDFKKKRASNMKLNGSKPPESMIKQMVAGMPDQSLFMNRIMVDKTGLVYVLIADDMNDVSQEMDIFSPDGEYFYHAFLKLPEGLKLNGHRNFQIRDGFLYAFAKDQDDEGVVVKCKIQLPINN